MKFLISLVLLCTGRGVFGETFPQCENLESGAFVGGTKGCKSYIYCDGEDSYEGVCPSQLLFNTKDGSCAPASEVDCVEGDGLPTSPPTTTTTRATTTTTTTTPVPTTTTTTTTTVQTTTPKPPSTTVLVISPPVTTTATSLSPTEAPGPSPIESVEELPEESPEVHTEDEESQTAAAAAAETTHRAPQTTSFVHHTSAAPSRPALSCPEVDRPHEVVFIPSAVSCNEYFLCYHGTPVQMSCSGELFFDHLTSKCELPERVDCLIPSATTPSPRKQCTANTFDFFPYPNNCNYFYKCINGFLSLQQCPVGFGWSDEMKLCVKLAEGRCPTGRLSAYDKKFYKQGRGVE